MKEISFIGLFQQIKWEEMVVNNGVGNNYQQMLTKSIRLKVYGDPYNTGICPQPPMHFSINGNEWVVYCILW